MSLAGDPLSNEGSTIREPDDRMDCLTAIRLQPYGSGALERWLKIWTARRIYMQGSCEHAVMQMPEEPRRIPFQYSSELDKFEKAFAESLRSYLDTKRAELMPAENVQAYRHGTAWRSGPSEEVSEMQSHEHGMAIKFDDVIAHDVSVIRRVFLQLAEAIDTSIVQMMYSTVSKAANAVGNTVSVKAAGTHAKAFLEMLKKIEFGVDRHGKPSLPEIRGTSPEMVDAFLKDLQKQGPEFENEVERIMQEKIAAAQEREHERRSRFKGTT